MKVWVVTVYRCGDEYVVAVYSSLEKAEQVAKQIHGYADPDGHDLDPVLDDKKPEDYT